MTQRHTAGGAASVHTSPPDGWTLVDPADEDLAGVIVGPRDSTGVRPRIEIVVEPPRAETMRDATQRVQQELLTEVSGSLLAALDIWPHPVWGEGRIIQTACVVDHEAVARDRYLFRDDSGRLIVVSVECLLEDLLTLEESVASIVEGLRVVTPAGLH